MGDAIAAETSPLLGHENGHSRDRVSQERHDSGDAISEESSSHDASLSRAAAVRSHLRRYATVYLCGLFILVVDVPGYMAEVNRVRMYELAVCRDWYSHANKTVIDPNGNIPEELCKIPAVQSELATFSGLQMMLDELVGMLEDAARTFRVLTPV
jgi:hypothetical protein